MGRRSRKRRAPAGDRPSPPATEAPSPRRTRGEERDARLRERLVPLASGERPAAVTAGAIVAGLLAIGNLIAYLAGLKVNGHRPPFTGIVVYEALLLAASIGMWRARYWAVLGFEFMLGFFLAFLVLFLTRATSLLGVAVVLGLGIPAGALFWFLIKAMARIQMPERSPRP